jgi:hypothetical protein
MRVTHGPDHDPEPMERRFAVGLDLMAENFRARLVLAAPLIASGLLVSGCMGSPTYGTDKTANAQLTSDLSGMFSLKPQAAKVTEYKPRPELVKPASLTELPPPQENIVTASNEAWPESPEQKRARIRAYADENRNNPGFDPIVVNDLGVPVEGQDMSKLTSEQRRAEIKRRLQESKQGSPTKRKYLSEPPLEYRAPAQTAAVDDIGEDEFKKERRIKRMARKKGNWRDLVPWL